MLENLPANVPLSPNEIFLFEVFEELSFFIEYSFDSKNIADKFTQFENILNTGEFNIDAQNDKGNTFLHLAFKHTQIPYVMLLLNKGANPFIQNNNKLTAFIQYDSKNPQFISNFQTFINQFVLGIPYSENSPEVKREFEWSYIQDYNDLNIAEINSQKLKYVSLNIKSSSSSRNYFKERTSSFHPLLKQALFDNIANNVTTFANHFYFSTPSTALQFLEETSLDTHVNFVSLCNNSFSITELLETFDSFKTKTKPEDNSLLLNALCDKFIWKKDDFTAFEHFISHKYFSINFDILKIFNDSYAAKQFDPYVDNIFYHIVKNVIDLCIREELKQSTELIIFEEDFVMKKIHNTLFDDDNTLEKVLNSPKYEDLYSSLKMSYTLDKNVPHKNKEHKKKKI